jgi:hypothetical protein
VNPLPPNMAIFSETDYCGRVSSISTKVIFLVANQKSTNQDYTMSAYGSGKAVSYIHITTINLV